MARKSGADLAIKKLVDDAGISRIEVGENAQSLLPLPELVVDGGVIISNQVGRKKGALNKSTRDMIETLQKMGRPDPLDNLSLLASRPVEVLAAELSCSKLDAAKLQKSANETLVTYYHARRAPENQEGDAMPEINIYAGMSASGEQVDYFDYSKPELIEDAAKEIVIDQDVSEVDE